MYNLLMFLEKNAQEYRLIANDSLRKNQHMIEYAMKNKPDISQEIIDALLVDFINYVGTSQRSYYGLQVKHLKEDNII